MEVMVALAILGAAFLALLTVHRQSLHRWQESRDATRIYLVAQELINKAVVTGTLPSAEGQKYGVSWRLGSAPTPFPDLIQVEGQFRVEGGSGVVAVAQWVRPGARGKE